MNASKCCVLNCKNTRSKYTLHMFPNPEKEMARFNKWIYAIGGNVWVLDPKSIFKNGRVCYVHFEKKFHTASKRLSRNAIPSLCLSCVPLHYFPNPEKNPIMFQNWVKIVGGDIVSLDKDTIHKTQRICHRHFQDVFLYPKNRLCKLAVPSLYLPSGDLTGKVHHFPPPEFPYSEKFDQWKVVLSEIDKEKGDKYIYIITYIYVITILKTYKLGSGRLTKNAVPTLNIASTSTSSTALQSAQIQKTSCSVEQNEPANNVEITSSEDFGGDIDQDDSLPELSTDNVSSISIDKELSSEPETSHAIIARVYHYLQKEYECLKALVGGSCDMSPFADILRRTAEATGVTEKTVTSVLQESKCAEQHDDLDNNTTQESPLYLKCETYKEDTLKMDTSSGDDVYILDLREKDAVNAENENRQCTLKKKNSRLPPGLSKSNFVIQSALKESDGINSDILRKLQHCRWCSVRKRGYNNNLWMCKQCKVSLGLNKCLRICCRVPWNN